MWPDNRLLYKMLYPRCYVNKCECSMQLLCMFYKLIIPAWPHIACKVPLRVIAVSALKILLPAAHNVLLPNDCPCDILCRGGGDGLDVLMLMMSL